ncbi:helix-turn-helix transcriptional regulator [Conexibacter woesei]|uniref:Helix-turn-helix type 11 domain protein n=1 Tax=Conexibacter woesei (strain DSM 14684 / CCUG 47730 / CIP 108061 / JCM 11494 / NBRC 100937 / ID131577) TaxID=469383 RepID=D3EZ65_CONWI|nr:YafY family protein [Conexibacter woesei]ADB51830.1 Helix-turn-helix type 11 domain protein [Conexibacter woesei DSM 14684]
MSRPTTRVLELLELLQDRQQVTGPELAQRLGVDHRTVRRYIAKLEELGIPVEADRGRRGGYRLRPGFKLPPLMLTDDEASAVVLGLLAAQSSGLTTAAPAVESALQKLRRVLPVELRERVRALEQALGFTRPAPHAPAPPQTETVLALADAIGRERRVEVAYATRDGAASTRQLDPYGVVFHNGRWYLSAHDHGRGELRTLRLDRIGSVRILRRAAPKPPGFDAVEHVNRALARVPWTNEVEVVLDAPLAEIRRQVPPHTAELEQLPDGGGVLLRARAERLDGMARLLAGLGAPLVVRRPDALRDELRVVARRLTDAADAGGSA